jgi:hypothetical protein
VGQFNGDLVVHRAKIGNAGHDLRDALFERQGGPDLLGHARLVNTVARFFKPEGFALCKHGPVNGRNTAQRGHANSRSCRVTVTLTSGGPPTPAGPVKLPVSGMAWKVCARWPP